MRISAPSSSVQICSSGLSTTMSPTVWISPAVTAPGPCFFTTMRLGPSPCILIEMSLMLSTMSVTSSRTPAIEENSCSTPSICTDCTAAPCSEDNRMRRSALPRVWPKPRSSGSATRVAKRLGSVPGVTWSLFGRISSCQFFWIVTVSPIRASRFAFQITGVGDRGSARVIKIKTIAGRHPPAVDNSNPPALARTAAIVRDRGHVADRGDREARGLQRAQRRFAARTGAGDFHLQRAHAVFLRLLGDVFGRDLRGIGGRLGRTLARARIGVGALAAHRQAAAMTQAAIAAEVHQALDVHAGLAAQVAFDHIVAIDHFTNLQHFLIAQLRHPALAGNLDLLHDLGGFLLADAMDILKRDQHALVGRDIHAGNTGHRLLSCHRPIQGPAFLSFCRAYPQTRTRRPSPGLSWGPASLDVYPTGYGAY